MATSALAREARKRRLQVSLQKKSLGSAGHPKALFSTHYHSTPRTEKAAAAAHFCHSTPSWRAVIGGARDKLSGTSARVKLNSCYYSKSESPIQLCHVIQVYGSMLQYTCNATLQQTVWSSAMACRYAACSKALHHRRRRRRRRRLPSRRPTTPRVPVPQAPPP